MDASAHTPGPWVLKHDEHDDALHVSTIDRLEQSTVPIATVGVGYEGPVEAEQRANARLIAASPDLLAAAKAAEDALSADGLILATSSCGQALRALRAAIAKTEAPADAKETT